MTVRPEVLDEPLDMPVTAEWLATATVWALLAAAATAVAVALCWLVSALVLLL